MTKKTKTYKKSTLLSLIMLLAFCWITDEAIAADISVFTKTDYPVEDTMLTGVHPNVLFLLDTGSAMVFTPSGIMPETGDGRALDVRQRLLRDYATYGSGARPASINGTELTLGNPGAYYPNQSGETALGYSRFGRDLVTSNNIIGNPDCYYSPYNDPGKTPYWPYFLTFKNRAFATWNGTGTPPSGFPAQLLTYIPGRGGANIGKPVTDPDLVQYLVPNDSRMYQMKLVLWRILGESNAEMFEGMRVAMATSYREDSFSYYSSSKYMADFYFNPPTDSSWSVLNNLPAPEWAGVSKSNAGNMAWAGIDRAYYENSTAKQWAQVNRSNLIVPFDYLYKLKDDGTHQATPRLADIHEYIDGIEDANTGGFTNRELFADGKTPLATSIFGRRADVHNGKVDTKDNPVVRYASQTNLISYATNPPSNIPLNTVEISSDPKFSTASIRAGQAVGSVIDFFSPPKGGSNNLDFINTAGSDTRGFFPVTGSCQPNWLVVFTSVNDSLGNSYSAANAVQQLFQTTKTGMRGREWNGTNWVERTFAMDSGVRTLVVGFVNSSDSAVTNLVKSLEDMAKEGDPMTSEDQYGNKIFVENPQATPFFASDVPSLIDSLNSVLNRINADKFSSGAPVVLPLRADDSNEKILFSSSYKVRDADQWQGWFTKFIISDDEPNPANRVLKQWEFNDNRLVPAKNTRRVYTSTEAVGTIGGPTVQDVNSIGATLLESLTGVPTADATRFKTWLREYDGLNIFGDMEHSGMFVFSPDEGTGLGNRDRVVYLQTNRGVVHAVDYENGNEKWAFIPPNIFQPRLKALKYHNETGNWLTGNGITSVASYPANLLDGAVVVKDMFFQGDGYQTMLVGNLGWGGNGFYGMNVTDPDTTPGFLWAVDNARYMTSADPLISGVNLWGKAAGATNTDYSALGLTIVPPVLLSVDISTSDKSNVGFLPGGLGYYMGVDEQGKIFYVFDPRNGNIVKTFTDMLGFEAPSGTHLGMGITPVTQVRDEEDTVKYFVTGDSEGNVLYCDTIEDLVDWKLRSVFQLRTTSNDLPVAITRSLLVSSRISTKDIWLFGGTSDLSGPDKDTENAAFRHLTNAEQFIFGFNLTKTSGDASLETTSPGMEAMKYQQDGLVPPYGVTLTASDNVFNADVMKGWYLKLRPRMTNTLAEYVTTSPYLYHGILYVSTFIPSVRDINAFDYCPNLGHSKLYALDPLTGMGMWGTDSQGVGQQALVLQDIKIAGIAAMGGKLYIALKPLKGTAMDNLPSRLTPLGGSPLAVLDELNPVFEVSHDIKPDVPYIQYWRESF